jgi:hypothetical protein
MNGINAYDFLHRLRRVNRRRDFRRLIRHSIRPAMRSNRTHRYCAA